MIIEKEGKTLRELITHSQCSSLAFGASGEMDYVTAESGGECGASFRQTASSFRSPMDIVERAVWFRGAGRRGLDDMKHLQEC